MKDETSPTIEPSGGEQLEARIVAWIMGEASVFEVAELERLCAERPDLEAFRREIEGVAHLFSEDSKKGSDWRLPTSKREVVEALFQQEGKENAVRRSGRRAWWGIAACLALTAGVWWYGMSIKTARTSSREVVQGEVADEILASVFVPPQPEEPVIPAAPAVPAELAANERRPRMERARMAAPQSRLQEFPEPTDAFADDGKAEVFAGKVMDDLERSEATDGTLVAEHQVRVGEVRRGLYLAEGNFNLGKYDDAKEAYEEVLRVDPYNAAARRGIERIAVAKEEYLRAGHDVTRAELRMQVDEAWELAAPVDEMPGQLSAWRVIAEPGGEMTSAEKEPVSTFSLNVSDVSFQLAKAALEKGQIPDPAQIKVEQFYNAVDYGDAAASAGENVAGTIQQMADPFLPGTNLVRIGIRTGSEGRVESRPLRLTLLVDQSGSMLREDRREALEMAVRELGGLLKPEDRVTVIGFSRTSRLLAEGLRGNDEERLLEAIWSPGGGEGTNLEEAMVLGEELAVRHHAQGAQNRMVLFTDGAANLGDADPERLAERVTALRLKGIAFDVAGVGMEGLNDRLLGELARNGSGRYQAVGPDFAKRLAGAFRPAAEDVKVQVRFNPERVSLYRLVGFEEDRLAEEDFRNDAVDAAELAADESGVALYQVKLLARGEGEIGEVAVRFRDVESGEMVERSWTIGHDLSVPTFDRAAPSMQLAGLAMMAGEKLQRGPVAEMIDFTKFQQPIAAVREYYSNSSKVSDLLRMIELLSK